MTKVRTCPMSPSGGYKNGPAQWPASCKSQGEINLHFVWMASLGVSGGLERSMGLGRE